jgi:hypothetical protein
MIQRIEYIPTTKDSYPFASAEKYCKLSQKGFIEKEYYMYGTANVYKSVKNNQVVIKNADVSYINRIIIRAPKLVEQCSGNVVIEIINPTSFMEIDRMWILGKRQFLRNGDIYIGITSKPNTIPKLVEFNQERYGKLSWPNPTPDIPFDFQYKELEAAGGTPLPDQNIEYEPGLFWDMLTELAQLIRSDNGMNPILEYKRECIVLTGWSQSACYMTRYINTFVYRSETAEGPDVFDGFLSGGMVPSCTIPVNQYETIEAARKSEPNVNYVRNPFILIHTESENGRFDAYKAPRADSDEPDYLYRCYDIAGATHDTMGSYVNYYQNDPDLIRIHHLPVYTGKHVFGNDYPSDFLFSAAYRNLFYWIRTGVAPSVCEKIHTDCHGENLTDAFHNAVGGLRTCLINYPTASYYNTSNIEKGANPIFPDSDKEWLFGHEEPFSPLLLKELYGCLEHYRELVTRDTSIQVNRGYITKEDAEELIELAVSLAAARGLE